jgi:hypothetical protein
MAMCEDRSWLARRFSAHPSEELRVFWQPHSGLVGSRLMDTRPSWRHIIHSAWLKCCDTSAK